jgi:hypothetical protein
MRTPSVITMCFPCREDVLGLDVAVDHPVLVRVLDRSSDLLRDRQGLLDAELLVAGQPVPQRLAPDVGQDIPQEALVLAGGDEGEDVRVVEPRGELDLTEKPVSAEHRGQLRAQDFEGDVPVKLEVVCEVDGGHAALTQLTVEAVAIGERNPERVQGSHKAALRSGARSISAGRARRASKSHTARPMVSVVVSIEYRMAPELDRGSRQITRAVKQSTDWCRNPALFGAAS